MVILIHSNPILELLNLLFVILAQKARSTLWQDGGTGNRIFGSDVADIAVSKDSTQHLNVHKKQARRNKEHARKKGGRKRAPDNSNEDSEFERSQPLAAMQTLSI